MLFRPRLPLIVHLLAFLLMLSAGRMHGADIDTVILGDELSERQHQLAIVGSASAVTKAIEIGNQHERYRGRAVTGRGSALDLMVSLPGPAASRYLLEIEEIHDRQWQAFGYAVLVNGREICFRTYEEQAAGPNHWFVAIPADAVPDPGKIAVRLINRGNAGFVVSRMWMYRDFPAHAEAERLFQPLTIMGPGPMRPTASPDFELGYFKDEQANYSYNGSTALIDEVLGRTQGLGVPVQLAMTAWFSTCPGGPDGRGGYFSDPRYSQAIARDGRLYAQYPNVWGNSFGYPSMSEPTINRFLDDSRESTCRAIQRRLDLLKASGKPIRHLQLLSDVGPFYWDDADYSPSEIEAARRDGVTLAPGANTPAVRMWRFRHLAQVFARIASAFRAGVQRDSILVDRGHVVLPDDQLSENLYSHPWVRVGFPAGDVRWRGWQTGVVDGMWTTGEMGAGRQAVYDYIMARGKIGIGNMYIGKVPMPRLRSMLMLQYQRGWRSAGFYGTDPENWEALATMPGVADQPAMPPVHCERKALEVFFEITGDLGEPGVLVTAENVTCGQLGGVKGALRSNTTKPGRLIYRLDVSEAEDKTRATLFLMGNVAPRDVTIAVASTDGTWQPVGRLSEGQRDASLVTIGGKGGAVSSVELPRLPDGTLPSQVRIDFASGSIQRIRVGLSWDQLTGHAGSATTTVVENEEERRLADETWLLHAEHATDRAWTCREARLQSLWIQQRRMSELLIERYRSLDGDPEPLREAEAQMRDNRYASAYRRLIGEISYCLPARFAIRGHGPLGRFPIEVRLPDDDQIAVATITRLTTDRIDLALDADISTTATVIIRGLLPGEGYAVQQPAAGQVSVLRIQAGTDQQPVALSDGVLRVEVPVAPPRLSVPRTFTATFAKRDGRTGMAEFWPAPSSTAIHLARIPAKGAVLRRREAQASAWTERTTPSPGDWCEVEVDDQGVVRRIDAIYGEVTGIIASFIRPGFAADAPAGILALRDGRRFELSWGIAGGTRLDTALLQGNPHQYNFDRLELGLRAGQQVTLTYTPAGLPGVPDRLVAIRQATTVVLQDEVEGTEAEWRALPVSATGIRYLAGWRDGRKRGISGAALSNAAKSHDQPAEVVYRVSSDELLGDTGVHLSGRTIIDERNHFEVFASLDGKIWTACGEVSAREAVDPSCMNVDISAVARGNRTCLVKVRIAGTGDWCILWNVQVRTERTGTVLEK